MIDVEKQIEEAVMHLSQNLEQHEIEEVLRTLLSSAQSGERAADTERHLAIGKAIERACIDMPEGTELLIELEKGAGTVTMIDRDGNEHQNFDHEGVFAGVVNGAIDAAIAASQPNGEV